MKHSAINSSLILSAGYDETNNTLELTFSGGTIYQYSNVPQQIFEELLEADSKGSYYHSKIRGVYPSEKLG